MDKEKETVRVNVTISNELKEWYTKEAKSYGCSVSSMMAIALAQYKQNQESINAFKDMNSVIDRLQQLATQSPKEEN